MTPCPRGWQFVSFLDLLEHRIAKAGVRVVKLNGGMNLAQRDSVLTAFKEDPGVRVILISLKAGGVALNLTVASRIFLMDPWWNPAAEYQAIDRAHRLGQHKPIRAVRFVVRNTVEERILRLQDKKRLVFEGTVGGDAVVLRSSVLREVAFPEVIAFPNVTLSLGGEDEAQTKLLVVDELVVDLAKLCDLVAPLGRELIGPLWKRFAGARETASRSRVMFT